MPRLAVCEPSTRYRMPSWPTLSSIVSIVWCWMSELERQNYDANATGYPARNRLLRRDFRLDERGKLSERLLPAEIAHLQRNGRGQTFLHHVELGSAENLLQGHGRLHF